MNFTACCGWLRYLSFPVPWMAVLTSFSSIALAGDPGTVLTTAWNYGLELGLDPGLTNIVAVSVRSNALFLKTDSTVLGLPAVTSNVVAIAAGYSHNVALLRDGTVRQWAPPDLPPPPPDLTNVISLVAGSRFTCALKNDGRVIAWGRLTQATNVPAGLTNVVAIAAGSQHVLALTGAGNVVGWGSSSSGATPVPSAVTNIAFIAAEGFSSAAATSDGVVWRWGEGYIAPNQTDVGRPIQQLAITRNRTYLLDGNWNLLQIGPQLIRWNVTNFAGIFGSESNLYAIARGPVLRPEPLPPQYLIPEYPPVVRTGGYGENLAFKIIAESYHPFTYQWFFNGTPLSGANRELLRLTGLSSANNGTYFLMVSNIYGTMTSAPVRLNVTTACDEPSSQVAEVTSDTSTASISPSPPVLPPGIVYTNIPQVAPPGFTSMAFAPDGRIFLCQQRGSIHIAGPWPPRPPFATLIQDGNPDENGLLGIAFDPGFQTNSFLYVHYTLPIPDLHNRISRLTANGNVVKPCSEKVLVEVEYPRTSYNHRGGALHFGPDGKLYAGVGDHFGGSRDAQSLDSLVGKILRINPDGTIPEDNPFYDVASGPYRAIWAMGLRNPFTFAIHPRTGRMLINDVGSSWEEVNEGLPGANFGWPYEKGSFETNIHTNPVYSYPTGIDPGGGCASAIIGAAFYDPPRRLLPEEYVGSYFFGDYCKGWIRRLDTNGVVHNFATNLLGLVDIDVGPDGALYCLTGGGAIYRFTAAPSRFLSAEQLIDGRVHLRVTGAPNQPYILEQSTDLENWQPLSTNQSSTNPFDLYDPDPPNNGQRFYRLRD